MVAKTDTPRGRRAFTLVELLAVIVIGAIILTILAGGLIRARQHARHARAETELRELVKGWSQYWMTYGSWPAGYDGQTKEMTYANLQPLIDTSSSDNKRKIAFLAIKISDSDPRCLDPVTGQYGYLDPWKRTYQITFKSRTETANETSLRVSVAMPNRDRYRN